MTAPAVPIVELASLLYVLPSPAGGRLCVTGTGISVRKISILYNEGLTPDEIVAELPHLTLPGVHAAIAYYLANRPRMDAELEEELREFDAAKKATGGKPVRYTA